MLTGLRSLQLPAPVVSSNDLEILRKINEDFVSLEFNEYLHKYFLDENSYNRLVWDRIQKKLVTPAYDVSLHEELKVNFGYSSIDKHNFKEQERVYNTLSESAAFPDDVNRFIGFMAGTGYFEHYKIELADWLQSKTWIQPSGTPELPLSLIQIIKIEGGLNFIKSCLIALNYWRR